MAKRLKLIDAGGEERAQMDTLLEVPEADKLRKLDSGMTLVLNQSKKPLKQRLKEHAEMLAKYRQALEKLQRQGGTSILQQTTTREPFQEMLKKHGVQFDESQVHIPGRKKAKRTSFSKGAFEKAVDLLTSQDETSPAQIEEIIKKVFDLIKDHDVNEYPMLKKMYRDQMPKFNGRWNKL